MKYNITLHNPKEIIIPYLDCVQIEITGEHAWLGSGFSCQQIFETYYHYYYEDFIAELIICNVIIDEI